MGRPVAELRETPERLRGAEARAERSGNKLLRRDPIGNRSAAEAGSFLATCDEAVKRFGNLLSGLDRVEGEPPRGDQHGRRCKEREHHEPCYHQYITS